jgi:hypothetical protein
MHFQTWIKKYCSFTTNRGKNSKANKEPTNEGSYKKWHAQLDITSLWSRHVIFPCIYHNNFIAQTDTQRLAISP